MFYTVCISIFVTNTGDAYFVQLAYWYFYLRTIHSFYHIFFNHLAINGGFPMRAMIWIPSTAVLVWMWIRFITLIWGVCLACARCHHKRCCVSLTCAAALEALVLRYWNTEATAVKPYHVHSGLTEGLLVLKLGISASCCHIGRAGSFLWRFLQTPP